VTLDQTVLLAVGVLAVLCLLLLVAVLRLRASGAAARAEVETLRERLDRLEARPVDLAAQQVGSASEASVEFVITDLGSQAGPEPEAVRLEGAAFADIVLKETVVKAASLAHGLRRGLEPATRNRIRFEMRQEVRRARKQRRADLKAAQRDLHARHRADLRLDTEEAS
jgi:hypothetical protein